MSETFSSLPISSRVSNLPVGSLSTVVNYGKKSVKLTCTETAALDGRYTRLHLHKMQLMKNNFGLALLAACCLAASAAAQEAPAPRQVSIEFGGKSIITALDNIFRGDIMPKLIPLSTVLTGCREPIEKIDTEILEMPVNPSKNNEGQLTSGVLKERWSLTKCHKVVPVYVTVEFLASGQTAHTISANP